MTNEEKIDAVKQEMTEFRQKLIRASMLKVRLIELEDDINNPSISVGGSNVRSGTISAGAARLVLIKSEVEEQLGIALAEYNDFLKKVLSRMRKLPLTERTILEQRYIYDTPAKIIMAVMGISKSTYYEMLDKAYIEYHDTD